MNNLCEQYSATSMQQLTKLVTDVDSGELKEKNVYPVSVIQAIFDGITGTRLDTILSLFNCIYIPYTTSKEDTRLKIGNQMRRIGLIISFKEGDTIYTQRYIGTNFDDNSWKSNSNWVECFISYDESELVNNLKEFIKDYISNNLPEPSFSFNIEIVDVLPDVGVKGTIYLIKDKEDENNKYTEYIWLDTTNSWEIIGSTNITLEVDNSLSDTSENPVQNKVITATFLDANNAINSIRNKSNKNENDISSINSSIASIENDVAENGKIKSPRIILEETAKRVFHAEFQKAYSYPPFNWSAPASIGWAGALLIDDFSSEDYRYFHCFMTYGQGVIIRQSKHTDEYEYFNHFIVDPSTSSANYAYTNKLNSGGWYRASAEYKSAIISRCSPSVLHTYYVYNVENPINYDANLEINGSRASIPYTLINTIRYTGAKLANITSDVTCNAEDNYLYIHGYKAGSTNAISGTSIIMVFNKPELTGDKSVIDLTDNDILWTTEFYVDEAAQDIFVSGGVLYYPYGGPNHCGLAAIDVNDGRILQNIDILELSSNFVNNPEPEGVYISNGKLYLNYHHSGDNSNEVYLVEFDLQNVKESVYIPNASNTNDGLLSKIDKLQLDNLVKKAVITGYISNSNNFAVLSENNKGYVSIPQTAIDRYGILKLSNYDDKSIGIYKLFLINNNPVIQITAPTITNFGVIKVGYPLDEENHNYPVEVTAAGIAYVHVPISNNTSYSIATPTSDGLMSKEDKSWINSIINTGLTAESLTSLSLTLETLQGNYEDISSTVSAHTASLSSLQTTVGNITNTINEHTDNIEYLINGFTEYTITTDNNINNLTTRVTAVENKIVILTQNEYDALETKNENTIYFIKG